jgi:tetratricopeptide (TPR) repeat protein
MLSLRVRFIACAVMLSFAFSAHAESFHERLAAANALLQQGLYDEATSALQELKVDHPDEPAVDYALGAAQYQRAEGLRAAGKGEEAMAAYQDAETRFSGIAQHADSGVANAAAFARANALTQQAKLTASSEKYKESIAALRNAEAAYVELLTRDPGNTGAQKNLDHLRFQLKQLLQNPPQNETPPEQEKQEPPKDQPPRPVMISVFHGASTELPGAVAVAEGNIVTLQAPEGAAPAAPAPQEATP